MASPLILNIDSLPSDLLEMVFIKFARRHLLRIVSFVCKRWRRAALASVTKISVRDLWDPMATTLLPQNESSCHR